MVGVAAVPLLGVGCEDEEEAEVVEEEEGGG